MQKDMFYDACKHILMENLSTRIFVEEVLQGCLIKGKILELQSVILKIDPSLQRSQNYLQHTCKYLLDKNYSDQLYSFQLFMKDYSKAALRCLKLFIDQDEIDQKIRLLNQAEKHFLDALKNANKQIIPQNLKNKQSEKRLL